ncbi:MAG TPA: DUF2147 domain-containing protein [Allosphingosinicella sp.]|nr:DUF2147 domain-containing protein [Allosphingosinicella sp.]
MIPIILAAMAAAAPHRGPAADPVIGNWINPARTVVVRTSHCGGGLCGRVVWASPQAQNSARAGGTDHLIGTLLFHDVRPAGPGTWQGEVFVPDLDTTADGNLMLLDDGSLEIDGCRLHGLLCRKQVWHKIAALPR